MIKNEKLARSRKKDALKSFTDGELVLKKPAFITTDLTHEEKLVLQEDFTEDKKD